MGNECGWKHDFWTHTNKYTLNTQFNAAHAMRCRPTLIVLQSLDEDLSHDTWDYMTSHKRTTLFIIGHTNFNATLN